MGRLTKRTVDSFGIHRAVVTEPVKQSCCTGCKSDCGDCSFKKSIDKLADFEDTGLTPINVAELAQVNKQLKELLRLAVEDMREVCCYCKKQNDCTSRKGSHKYCWQWQHADKMKGFMEE